MSWYEITHCCGHERRVQIYGTNVHGERDRKVKWLETQLCPECRKAAELAEIAAYEQENGLSADMRGSVKQVAWARRLRWECLKGVFEIRQVDEWWPAITAFANTKDASFWIDERDCGKADSLTFLSKNEAEIVAMRIEIDPDYEVQSAKQIYKPKGVNILYVVELPDGTFHAFSAGPLRKVRPEELNPVEDFPPEGTDWEPAPAWIWRFYGFEKTAESVCDAKAMGVEGVPRDMAAALELARESKATATVKLKLSIEEYLKLEIIAADRRKSVEELLREQVESLTKG